MSFESIGPRCFELANLEIGYGCEYLIAFVPDRSLPESRRHSHAVTDSHSSLRRFWSSVRIDLAVAFLSRLTLRLSAAS